MTFLSLSDNAKAYILVLSIFGFILLLIALIAYMVEKNKRARMILLSFLLAASIINFSILLHLNKIGRIKYDISLTHTFSVINSVPYYVHIVLCLLFIFYAIFSIFTLYKNNKNIINSFSVKEALENLPTGIAFMKNDVGLLLSNHIIHNLCKELTGKPLLNAETFWQDIKSLQVGKHCVIKGTEPAFVLSDGNVWQFSKNLCIYNNDEYYEFKATDVTQLYNISESTRNANEKLTYQQERLKQLTYIIEDNVENGVALNMKINFHDNFGNLLTLTKKTLRDSDNIDEVKTLIDYWKDLSTIITELSSNENHCLTLEQVLLFAEKLGCELILTGDLPKDEHNKLTVLLCINEMLKNAYRHAEARKIIVNITNTTSMVEFTIYNKTKNMLVEIKEGSGLSGLRWRIEQTGGEMNLFCDDGVTMSVKLL